MMMMMMMMMKINNMNDDDNVVQRNPTEDKNWTLQRKGWLWRQLGSIPLILGSFFNVHPFWPSHPTKIQAHFLLLSGVETVDSF